MPFNIYMKSFLYSLLIPLFALFTQSCSTPDQAPTNNAPAQDSLQVFEVPDTSTIPSNDLGHLIRFGKALIENTAFYIGPEGIKSQNTRNQMSCTNCHLQNGTKAYGLNFFNTYRSYPQFRGRENKILNLAERVNNCIERPHNGTPIPVDSKEMQALIAYIQWIGDTYQPNKHKGYGQMPLDYSGLAADSKRGEKVYIQHCQTCHMKNGEGLLEEGKKRYVYPPLWGEQSYQESSSMHRVLKAARFIRFNMPNLTSNWENPTLSVQEALDVAAFINDGQIHSRPKATSPSYPNPAHKPIDYFRGPYLDPFTEQLHRFGPWDEILGYYKTKGFNVID